MAWLDGLARFLVRVAALLAPGPWRRRLRDEWTAELDTETRRRRGWALVRAASGAFADAAALRKLHRRSDANATMDGWMSGWFDDLRVGVRSLRRSPAFTGVSALTLAIGLAGSAALYSVLDRVVLDPLPYPEAHRLVRLENQVPGVGPDEHWALSTAQFVYFTEHARGLESVGLYRYAGGNVTTASGAVRVHGVSVTATMMELLGARAHTGRLISAADDQPEADRVALLSHGFWLRLGADSSLVGTTLSLDGEPIEIVGVLEPGLEPPGWPASLAPDVWLPMRVDRAGPFYNSHVYPAVGRLAPNATADALEAEIAAFTPQLPGAFPQAYSTEFFDRYGFRTEVTPLKTHVLGDMATNLWLAFAGVGVVLVVAFVNILNLFLVRAEVRSREVAVRAALGAGRARLLRHVLVEALAIAILGGAAALPVAYLAVPGLTALAPADLPRIAGVALGLEGVGLTLVLSISVGVGLAVGSALLVRDRRPAAALEGGGRSSTVGRAGTRIRSGLVVTQVALALTLTVAAGLVLQTLRTLRATDPGFDPERAVALDVFLSSSRYPDDDAVWSFYRDLLERIEALPGVDRAGIGEELPISGGFGCTVQFFEDAAVHDRVKATGSTTCAGQIQVTPGYFEALGIPLLGGRTFEASDNDDPTRGAVVVSRAFAERFWPGEAAVGKGVNPSGRSVEPFFRVVGVVGDVPAASNEGQAPLSQPAIAIYYPMLDNPDAPGNWGWSWAGAGSLVVRADGLPPAEFVPTVRRLIRELDPEVAVADVRVLTEVVADAMTEISFVCLLLSIAAAVALVVAAVGLYGTVSYWVGSRTREIGMRLAVGARPADVLRQVTGGALRLAAAGLVAGILLALAVTGVLERLLVGVRPTDPWTYGVGAVLLAVVTIASSWVPARRAARVDPAEALRAD